MREWKSRNRMRLRENKNDDFPFPKERLCSMQDSLLQHKLKLNKRIRIKKWIDIEYIASYSTNWNG